MLLSKPLSALCLCLVFCGKQAGAFDPPLRGEARLPPVSSRRDVLSAAAYTAIGVASLRPSPCVADVNTPTTDNNVLKASWSAIDGLNSKQDVVSFEQSAYKAMRDDPTRTPLFAEAIKRRLGSNPSQQSVLDLGTGPFALFAIIAAQAGAGKVYAIEADPEVAESARTFVKDAGFENVITVITEYSTKATLPEKVDFCVAEIVGSIASEEGLYATICDAHRFLKDPTRSDSWIPSRVQTYGAPASYTLHNILGPPEFDWTKISGGEPIRFNCRDKGLELLSDAVVMEDLVFAEMPSKEQTTRNQKKQFTFTIDKDRVDDNSKSFFTEYRLRSSEKQSEQWADQTAHSITGIACWPRIILDDQTVVNSRSYPDGGHQKSHWQTVLPIMAGQPIRVVGGEKLKLSIDFDLPLDVNTPPRYSMEGVIGA